MLIADIPSDTNKAEDEWSPLSKSGKTPPTSDAKQQHQVSSALSLFDDDDNDGLDDDDDIFGSKIIPVKHTISDTKNVEISPTTPSVAEKKLDSSIFDEFDKDPPIDEIPESKVPNIEETKHIPKSPITDKKLPTSSVLGLFDDDDDADEADLFGAKFVSKPLNVAKEQDRKEKPQQPKPIPTSSTAAKTSLFGDHDDEDDDGNDLFGGPPPLPEPVKQAQPKKVSQKIFSDDSSDDDLFGGGGGGGKMAQKNPPKSSADRSSSSSSTVAMPKNTSKNTKTSEKLFSDSEDDDLFGGSKSKSTGS